MVARGARLRDARSVRSPFLLACALVSGCGATPTPEPAVGPASAVRVPAWAEGEPKVVPESTALPAPAPATTSLGALESSPKKTFSGRRIDLDVKDADIHDVCRMLAEIGHVNIVVADDVKGAVTLKLKSVPWDQALELAVRAKGFHFERDGNVIAVTAK
jgi:hypothetical protein